MLQKEQKILAKTDAWQGDILQKILNDANLYQWELALEYCVEELYYNDIPLSQPVKNAIAKVLDIYERPDFQTRGEDKFGNLLATYKTTYQYKDIDTK